MSKEILLLGEYSSGKSAFINMLLGVSLLPERVASTNLPVIKVHAAKPAGIWLREEGQKNPLALDRWSDIPKDWESFMHAEVTVTGHPLLDQRLVLWDTPGINTTLKHHQKHLEQFLSKRSGRCHTVLFFVQGNLAKTSLEFLKRWDSLWDRMTIVVNIKDRKREKECRKIEVAVKKTVRSELGSIPVELLYVGDVCEEFNQLSADRRGNLTDWELMRKWEDLRIDLQPLLEKHEPDVIGDYVFDLVRDVASAQDSAENIEPEDEYLPREARQSSAPLSPASDAPPTYERRSKTPLVVATLFVLIIVVLVVGSYLSSERRRAREDMRRQQATIDVETTRRRTELETEYQRKQAEVDAQKRDLALQAEQIRLAKADTTESDTLSRQLADSATTTSAEDEISDSEIYPVEVDHKIGYINEAGRIVIAPQYDAAKRIDDYEFREGLARVKLNGKLGFIDQTGRIVVPFQFDDAFPFSEGLACVKANDAWGYIDKRGEWVIRPQFKTASQFRDGLFATRDGDKVGFMNIHGEVVLPPKYETVGAFYDGMAAVKLNGKRGFINKKGETVIGLDYDDVYHFNEGSAPVRVAGKWGYVDQQGRMIIKPQFAEAYPFYGGLAVVRLQKEGPAGYIDQSGRLVVPPQFTWAAHFMGDRAWVWKGDACGYIDKTGKFVWVPPQKG
jgi:hypothetical protein